jgi:hypothetical protein
MFFHRLALRGALAAASFLLAFSCSLPAQYERPSRRLPAASPAEGSFFSKRDCLPANLDAHLPSPVLRGTPHLPNCEASPADTPASSPCDGRLGYGPGCSDAGDFAAQSALETLGKKGKSIFGARARVLKILEAGDACSAWFRDRAPDPAHLFRTLSFTVDSKAIDYVTERPDNSSTIYIHPYVAHVVQDGGEFQNVALNAGGAFFRPSANLIRLAKQGGAVQFEGTTRMLKVGPYMGSTLQAQITTLLHELGHVEGLLPLDTDDVNGQSSANTREVLRHCQPEIDSAAKHRSL